MQKLNRRSLLLVGLRCFHVFRRWKPDFPAVSRCTGGHCRVAGLCRICGQRDRSAGYWRDRCRACRRAVRAGRACASAICADICAAGLPVDRSVSGHPAHGEYIVPNAHAARWRRCNAAADLLYCVLCGSVFRCTAPGKADKLARTHSVSDADRTDFRAVFGSACFHSGARMAIIACRPQTTLRCRA